VLRVARAGHAPREGDRGGIAVLRGLVDRRATRVRQAEHTRDLVVRLAGRVVHSGPQLGDRRRDVVDAQQLRVPTGDQQRQARRGQRPVLQGVHRDVPGQVVHPVQGHVQRRRVRLGRRDADEQRARQARAGRHGDRVHIGQRKPGLLERARGRGDHRFEVRAAGDLGHHTAEAGVLLDAGGDLVGEQLDRAVVVQPDQADAGLVARAFDAHDDACHQPATPSRARAGRTIVYASAPEGW
jgi:hypothetical protein